MKHYTSAMFLNFALSLGFRFWQHLFFFFFFLTAFLLTNFKVKPNPLFFGKHIFEKPLTEEDCTVRRPF